MLFRSIYNIKSTKYEKNVENLHLFLAKNQYSEIENIAKTITKLVREKGLRYKDVAIIAKNIDTYSSLIRSIFSDYEIPVFIDEKRDLNQNIIVQYIISILEIFASNFSNESIFNYIKLGFLIAENFLITLLGGVAGLILCLIFGYFFSDMIFTDLSINREIDLSLKLLIDWKLYGAALAFCFLQIGRAHV